MPGEPPIWVLYYQGLVSRDSLEEVQNEFLRYLRGEFGFKPTYILTPWDPDDHIVPFDELEFSFNDGDLHFLIQCFAEGYKDFCEEALSILSEMSITDLFILSDGYQLKDKPHTLPPDYMKRTSIILKYKTRRYGIPKSDYREDRCNLLLVALANMYYWSLKHDWGIEIITTMKKKLINIYRTILEPKPKDVDSVFKLTAIFYLLANRDYDKIFEFIYGYYSIFETFLYILSVEGKYAHVEKGIARFDTYICCERIDIDGEFIERLIDWSYQKDIPIIYILSSLLNQQGRDVSCGNIRIPPTGEIYCSSGSIFKDFGDPLVVDLVKHYMSATLSQRISKYVSTSTDFELCPLGEWLVNKYGLETVEWIYRVIYCDELSDVDTDSDSDSDSDSDFGLSDDTDDGDIPWASDVSWKGSRKHLRALPTVELCNMIEWEYFNHYHYRGCILRKFEKKIVISITKDLDLSEIYAKRDAIFAEFNSREHWRPENHLHFPPEVRKEIWAFYEIVQLRKDEWWLPPELFFIIAEYISWDRSFIYKLKHSSPGWEGIVEQYKTNNHLKRPVPDLSNIFPDFRGN